jgi:hypothetical protein
VTVLFDAGAGAAQWWCCATVLLLNSVVVLLHGQLVLRGGAVWCQSFIGAAAHWPCNAMAVTAHPSAPLLPRAVLFNGVVSQ